MPVCLPQHEANPEARRRERAEARSRYRYTWHRPEGVASALQVPERDRFGAGVLVRFGGVQARLKTHEAKALARSGLAELERARESTPLAGGWLRRWVEAIGRVERSDRRATPEVARRWFGDEPPPFVAQLSERPQRRDRLFAWQRLGGANPMNLRRAEDPRARGFTEAHFASATRALGSPPGTLADAVRGGRAFLADWRFLAHLPTGVTGDGLDKRVYPAQALFVSAGDELLPVAIRCTDDGPAFTPADGERWEMAKLVAQCADAHEQALKWHLARCHFLMEAFTLATMRQLADAHPLKRLLAPHMQYTLAINHQVRDTLMRAGQDLEVLLATTRGASLDVVGAALRDFDYALALPPADVEARGLTCRDALPHCPYRDDGLDVWGAIHDFIEAYVALYYASDAEVAEDREVREWTDELRSHWGGRLDSVPVPRTRDALTELVSFIVWTAGPFHGICNYSQYEYMSLSTNLPTALFGEPPGADAQAADLHALYMPERLSMTQYGFFYEQTRLRENQLGRYPDGTFEDPRVVPLQRAFTDALAAVDARIVERNATRPAAYEWLRPHHTCASIHT